MPRLRPSRSGMPAWVALCACTLVLVALTLGACAGPGAAAAVGLVTGAFVAASAARRISRRRRPWVRLGGA